MIDIAVTDENGLPWIRLQGRIDSMTAPDLEKCLNELVSGGGRTIVLDMQSVHYMSSLGMRVLLNAQKLLKKADGEILICGPPPFIMELLEMSGFKMLFRLFPSRESLKAELSDISPAADRMEIDGIHLQCICKPADMGRLVPIGHQEKLIGSRYEKSDVVTVKADRIQYGAGLASIGNDFDEFRLYFGEAVILNHSLFYYPAVKRPAADFMLCTPSVSNISYHFLHGFSFSGNFSHRIAFESANHPVDLEQLSQVLGQIVPADLFAMVFIAESKGIWGMHLKRVPLSENRPANGKGIFHPVNFADWVNFPVERADIHHILVGAGLVIKNPDRVSQPIRDLFAAGSRVHCHAAVFSKEPISKNPDQFENELNRVITELPVAKVQHLMGQSTFQHGIVGIIQLENN